MQNVRGRRCPAEAPKYCSHTTTLEHLLSLFSMRPYSLHAQCPPWNRQTWTWPPTHRASRHLEPRTQSHNCARHRPSPHVPCSPPIKPCSCSSLLCGPPCRICSRPTCLPWRCLHPTHAPCASYPNSNQYPTHTLHSMRTQTFLHKMLLVTSFLPSCLVGPA